MVIFKNPIILSCTYDLAVASHVACRQMHGGGAKKGGSGSDVVVNDEPSKRGGAIGGKRGGKASGTSHVKD